MAFLRLGSGENEVFITSRGCRAMVGVEEIADRNKLQLVRTSTFNQYKAHCPICKDSRRVYHLYVNTARDTFCCHKCAASGGAVQFHAWLKGITFEDAKRDLYPAHAAHAQHEHPAERLTRDQLHKIGFVGRTSRFAPKGVDPKVWSDRRKAELDWIWSEWQTHLAWERQVELHLQALVTPEMVQVY